MSNNPTTNPPAGTQKRWDPALYDSRHSFVSEYGADLVDVLSPQPGERILDLGCGTGHLADRIAGAGADVIGIDSSASMIEQARRNYPHLRFEVADAMEFRFPGPFQAVFSNAVIHWIKDPEKAVGCVRRALEPGGRFVAEFGAKGNIRACVEAVHAALEAAGYPPGPDSGDSRTGPWYFPSIGEFGVLLERQGFDLTYATVLDRPTKLEGGDAGFDHWVEMFLSDLFSEVPMAQRAQVMSDVIRQAKDRLRPHLYRDGAWYADYKRIRTIAVKSGW